MNDFRASAHSYSAEGVNLTEMALPRVSAQFAGASRAYAPRPTIHQPLASSRDTPQFASETAAARPEILAAHFVRKSYRKASIEIPVLQGVELTVGQGEFVSIIGPSGCGKSTLLHLLATLDSPDSGEIRFEGHRIDNLPSAGRDILRNKYFGMVFQFYHLLPELTTLENVLVPAMIGEGVFSYFRRGREYRRRAHEMLELVGLGHRLKHKPRELSGGEMQRTAIARALVAQPRVLLADEPTGNLDKATGEEIMAILRTLNRQKYLTIVMVTHDPHIAQEADRTVTLVDGRVAAA